MKDFHSYFEANKDLWNAKTDLHYQSEFYGVEAFLQHRNSLNEIELSLLGDISGKSILHLQCHFGMDSLSMANKGAQVCGVDFSEKAIDKARFLAKKLDLDTRFLCSDIFSLPEVLEEKFDIVFVTYGAICWIPDMPRYAGIVSHFLKPGGELVLVEFHPFLYTYDFDTCKLKYPYANTGEAIEEEVSSTYASNDPHKPMKEFSWIHSLSSVTKSFLDKKLELINFGESDHSPYNCFSNMKEIAPGKYRFDPDNIRLPQLFFLHMRKKTL